MKHYLALARVSSREQEREGFSLDVQEEALTRYAERTDGEIVKLFRIAETASKKDERKTFKELLAYAKDHAKDLDAVLFYKVDRAARNLFDYVELERLEEEHGVACVYVAQPTENTPAGKLQRRILSNMASFYTEQQSVDVKEGMDRRVKSGLFSGKAPFGYRNVRIDGRSIVEVHPENCRKVQRIFELYAFHDHTVDGVRRVLDHEGIIWSDSKPDFTRSKVYNILRDRAYIGDLKYHGQLYKGTHKAIIDRSTFDRVQVLLGDKNYNAHDSVYGGGMVKCAFCGSPVVVEIKQKNTKAGIREYRYYRCANYTKNDHPRHRIKEAAFDAVILNLFDQIKVKDESVRKWIVKVLQAKTKDGQRLHSECFDEIKRQLTTVKQQRDRLLNLRLVDEINEQTFADKDTDLRDRQDRLELEIKAHGRQQSENADIALKVFELSQQLKDKWVSAEIPEKRRILEILCLNFSLVDANLCMTIRKPFDILSKGLSVHSGRGDRIRTCGLLLPKQPLYQAEPLPGFF